MKPKEELNIILSLCEYGYQRKSFSLINFYESVKNLDNTDKKYIETTLTEWAGAPDPNHIITFVTRHNAVSYGNLKENEKKSFLEKNYVRLLPSATFSYIDHLEIIEARKAAKDARRLSWIAIVLTALGIVAQIIAVA